jgi:2,4-dienoyl-CoA reductase-like NADH-dependent reductase (Old Yellow Enzyme family)
MPHLFDPLPIRGLTLPNRIVVSPMCQYSAIDGVPNEWHLVHLGSRAVGGAGLVLSEATAVVPEGRISPDDLGLWNETQQAGFARLTAFVRAQGGAAGVQLAHAGRKASTWRPWSGQGAVPEERGGWTPVAPGAAPFAPGFAVPRAMTPADIDAVVAAFGEAARRAENAGFDVIEVHAAHGYLLHEFLSPLTNTRADEYGGSFENRIRFLVRVVERVRSVWPERLPLFVRLSVTDWSEGGWDLAQSIELSRRLAQAGVDLVDCSSGGNVPSASIPLGPGYQTPFAAEIRRQAGIMTGTVGLITSAAQADHIVGGGQADCVLLARAMLRDPYWPLHAAQELGQAVGWPAQYLRAAPPGAPVRTALGASDR